MASIHPQYHAEIKNRRLQETSINEFYLAKGLKSTKGATAKDMVEIADMEDECLVKLKDMGIQNYNRNNVLLDDS